MKINLGSHNKRIAGYTNIDAQQLPNVDIVHDLTIAPWPIDTESVEEILTHEFLEHIEFRKLPIILSECYRILKDGGKIRIQVPDIEAMCRMVDLRCTCVPRKAQSFDDYKADPNCFKCSGKALIHPERWHYAFTGAQKSEWDLHRNVFTFDYLAKELEKVGFAYIEQIPNIYKLVVEAEK
jgi:hypothetical protein